MGKNKIIKNLELLGQQIKMTDEQKQKSEDFIMSRIKQDFSIDEKNIIPVWLKLADAFVPVNFRLQPVAIFSLIVGLFFVTSFASVNASKNTLPGHPLYQIKITAEQIRYGLSFSKVSQAKAAMSMVENRVGELKIIAKNENSKFSGIEKEKKVVAAVSNVKSSLNKVKDKLNSIKQENTTKSSEQEKQEVIAIVKQIDEKLSDVKDEIKQSGQELSDVTENIEEVSMVALAVLNQVGDDDGLVKGEQDIEKDVKKDVKDIKENTGIITLQATSTSSSSEQTSQTSQAVSAPILEPENILVIEEIEKESKEFGVGIGE